jgi:hypothetical protein
MMMPEIRQQQGAESDGEKHAGKRNTAPEGKQLTQVCMFLSVMAWVTGVLLLGFLLEG